jgi:hypothetical protein
MKNNNKGRYLSIALCVVFFILIVRFYLKYNEAKNVRENDKLTSIVITEDSTINLGSFKSGANIPFNFRIKNSGSHNLYIGGLTATCGCTDIKSDKKEASFNDSINVVGTIDTKGKVGKNLVIAKFQANTQSRQHMVRLLFEIK